MVILSDLLPYLQGGGQEKSHGHDDGGGRCPEALFWKNSVGKLKNSMPIIFNIYCENR